MPGAPGAVFLNGQRLERFVPISFHPGDVCVLQIPGGGGYGPPREREPELVRADVANGFVSPAAARDIYGIEL